MKKEIICQKCKESKTSEDFYYNRARKCLMKTCKKCNSVRCNAYQRGRILVHDIGFIMLNRATEIRRRCKQKGIPFDNDLKEILKEKLKEQKNICFYTGVEMVFSNQYHTDGRVMTVDRFDPSRGYTKDNIVLCSSLANRMKQNMTLEEFRDMCKKVLENTSKNRC